MSSLSKDCQSVEGTEVTPEWFGFLTTNQSIDAAVDRPLGIIYDNDIANLSYCFYKNYERTECILATDKGSSYRGRLNFTQNGLPCLNWNEISGIDPSIILEENYCRKLGVRSGMLNCYAKIGNRQRKMDCDPEYCSDIYSDDTMKYMYRAFQNVAYHRPVSTNVIEANLKGIVNGLSWRGTEDNVADFVSSRTYQPWLRVDLGARYLVHAVILYRRRYKCSYPNKWSNIAVWIHDFPSQFNSFGGQLCWEIEDLLNECNIEMRCVQALSGYYVTVQAYASASLEYSKPIDAKTSFEEIEIYGEATECGQYFGIGSGNLARYQVDVSKPSYTRLYQLNDPEGECFRNEFIVNIDLKAITTVEGLALNFNSSMSINIIVKYDRHNISKASEDFKLIFSARDDSTDQLSVKYFRNKLFARFIQLQFTSSEPENELCLTYDLIGCPKMILRDPLCSDKHQHPLIGVGVAGKLKNYAENARDVKILDIREADNVTDCEHHCLKKDDCVTWSFYMRGHECNLFTSTYLTQYSGSESTMIQKINPKWVAGEKVCLEGIIPAYPCRFESDLQSPMYITSPSYPTPYAPNLRCTWKIFFSNSSAVKITFLDLQFPTPQQKESEDSCVDFLSVGDREKSQMHTPHLLLTHANASSFLRSVTYLEEEEYLLVNFVTCGRSNVWVQAVFSMKIEKSDYKGCRNYASTCNNPSIYSLNFCSKGDFGYISTINYLGLYGSNMVCRWMYSALHPLKIDFVHFDIPGGEKCHSDNLTLYTSTGVGLQDFTNRNVWKINGVYCNDNPPHMVIYIKTDFGLEFYTDNSTAGTGFLLRWRRLKYEIKFYKEVSMLNDGLDVLVANGIDTSGKEDFFHDNSSFHFCERELYTYKYQLYLEYPFKCYLIYVESLYQNVLISWNQAYRKCKQHGGELVRIENRHEDGLIRALLEQFDANNTFIGLQRNHSNGQLYDSYKKKYMYTNWGFDKSVMSVEPNGLENSNCIMMKDLLEASGSSLTSSWADVHCNQKYLALVFCEQPIRFPWKVWPDEETRDHGIDRDGMLMTRNHYFRCGNGEYIMSELQCDRNNDCRDASDETECGMIANSVCPANRLYCGDNEQRCIHINLTCDFHNDCNSGVDEIGCLFPECTEGEWRCWNGQCIPESSHNDGAVDCVDQSDEITEGSNWHIEIHTSDVFDGDSSSDVFIKIYSENGSSQYIHLDRHVYKFVKGSKVSATTVISIENPTKIRIRHEVADEESPWYLEKVTLTSAERGPFVFDCGCAIPDPTTAWIPFRDISVNSLETDLPLLEPITFTVEVFTGSEQDSGTLNKVYMCLYGDKSDTGIFELKQTTDLEKQPFQSGNVDIFLYKTVDIGNVTMVKVYHFGSHFRDNWFLDTIIIHTSNTYESVSFKLESWIGVNVLDSNIGVTLPAQEKVELPYALKSNCPNKFECLDGQCIPRIFYCDQVVHCHGPFHEDEPVVCSPRHLRRSCLDMLAYSDSLEDYYDISFEKSAQPYKIHCTFGEDEHTGTVVSKVHHNLEYWVNITGEMELPVYYDIEDQGIDMLKQNTEFCSQRIETKCLYTFDDELYAATELTDWNRVSYRPYSEDSFSCNRNSSCNCMKSIKEWYPMRYLEYQTDNILITNQRRLPVRSLGFVLRHLHRLTKYEVRLHPLECFESLPTEKRYICNNGARYDPKYHCVLEYDIYGRPIGCWDFTHVTDCESFQCPAGYVKCRSGFCIPLYYICNGLNDCIHGEDEKGCNEQNTCVGALRCRNSTLCVASSHICDGTSNCPLEDDELLCRNSTDVIRSLTLTDTFNLNEYSFANYTFLANLNLSSVGIYRIESNLLQGLRNLLLLDISNNNIKELKEDIFVDLSRLKRLIVDGNKHLHQINPGAFNGLASLEKLEMTNMKISIVASGTFEGLDSLQSLNLSNNRISTLFERAFTGLHNLNTLDLRGNKIIEFYRGVFAGLDSLQHLISDLYLLCCISPSSVPEHQCLPARNEFSSCDDLMRNEGLRAFVWIIGICALVGNAFAVVYRFSAERMGFKTGNGVLLTNLCIADFLMGVYMVIIGSADAHFRGKYVWNDIAWRGGIMCKLAGFISFISNEMSGAVLCLITFNRYVTIRFPLERVGFTKKSAFMACRVCWGACILLAAVPLVGLPYFDEEFYTKSGVCLAHPLTTDRRGGWEYATVIFVFLNLFVFIFIAVGQILIFREIHKARRAMNAIQKRDDIAIARKLSLVVMTNFLCWFPVCIMGLIAMSGFVIDSEVYAWVAVFVLPLNSAANPIMYTLSSLFASDIGGKLKRKLKPRRKKELTETQEIEKLQSLYDKGVVTLCNQRGVRTLARHLDEFPMDTYTVMSAARQLAEAVDFIHSLGYVVGPFTCNEIVLEVNKHDEICNVSFLAMPTYSDTLDDVGNDIGSLGLVIKRMLIIHKDAD